MTYYASYVANSPGTKEGSYAYSGLDPAAIDWAGLHMDAISLFEDSDNVISSSPYTINTCVNGVITEPHFDRTFSVGDLVTAAHAHGTMVLYNIQAVGGGELNSVTTSDIQTSDFAKNIVEYMKCRKLDGI